MASQDEKTRHRKRLQNKKRDKRPVVKSPIAKSLQEPMFHQRIVRDKRGKIHDLETLSHKTLVELIQDNE